MIGNEGHLGYCANMATYLVNDRDTALAIGYDATDWSEKPDFNIYRDAMQQWDVKLIMRNTEPVGAAFFKDCEVHASILPQWRKRWATRGILNQLFQGQRVETRVSKGADFMYGILERLGFEDKGDGLMVMERK